VPATVHVKCGNCATVVVVFPPTVFDLLPDEGRAQAVAVGVGLGVLVELLEEEVPPLFTAPSAMSAPAPAH